jgi:hypothetical protein
MPNDRIIPEHLERVMWEIFSQIQIRAKQEGIDKILLGKNEIEFKPPKQEKLKPVNTLSLKRKLDL